MQTHTALLGKNLRELEKLVTSYGEPKFRGRQIAEWLYHKGATDISEMTNLPLHFRETLSRDFELGRSEIIGRQISKDGTEKYLYPVHGMPDKSIETVYIPENDRATLCISSQVGCKMNCYFCMTGRMGFHGNLSAGDIINQLLTAPHADKLTNVVFMGMGEPLDNYDQVAKVLEILTAPWGLAWSPKRITVSTVGPKRGLLRFLEEQQAHLAISIHNPFPEERLAMMPVEKAFPITEVIDTLKQYDFSGQRRLSFEYILFAGVNDSREHAAALVRLLSPLDCRVNLIRYHALPDSDLSAPRAETIQRFEDYLNSHGLRCTTRRSRGEDIFAACGMLSTTHTDATSRP